MEPESPIQVKQLKNSRTRCRLLSTDEEVLRYGRSDEANIPSGSSPGKISTGLLAKPRRRRKKTHKGKQATVGPVGPRDKTAQSNNAEPKQGLPRQHASPLPSLQADKAPTTPYEDGQSAQSSQRHDTLSTQPAGGPTQSDTPSQVGLQGRSIHVRQRSA